MLGGSVRERNGRFYVRLRVLAIDPATGLSRWRHIERAAGRNRRDAHELLRTLEGRSQDGSYLCTGLTVAPLGERWLTEHVQIDLKPGAIVQYRSVFNRHVRPILGEVRLEDCRPAMVVALLEQKRAEGLSEATVAKIRRHLHAMFAFAKDAGLATTNPANIPRAHIRPRAPRRARGIELSPLQVRAFLGACSPRWRSFFTVALDTGLRRGEMIGLRWGDVDLLGRIIHVRRSIGLHDKPLLTANNDPDSDDLLTTKTKAGERLVPILAGAQATLEQLYRNAQDADDRAPVFASIRGARAANGRSHARGAPLDPRMVSRVFRRYAQRAGLPASVRLHDLRHTAITNAIGQGESILLVSAFAGHASPATTMDVYAHLMPARVAEAARRVRSLSSVEPAPLTAQPQTPRAETSHPRISSPRHRPRVSTPARRLRATARLRLDLGPAATDLSWADPVASQTS